MGIAPVDHRVDWSREIDRAAFGPAAPTMVFQPIVDLRAGRVTGFEALARFDDSPTPPDVWFSQAASYGVADVLESRAIAAALRARAGLPTGCFLTVNVSPDLLPSDAVMEVLSAAGDLTGVVIELTEQTELTQLSAVNAALAFVRTRNAMVAVDDAGAGYAGLQRLLEIRPDMVKLDRALVDRVDQDGAKQALARMLGDLSGHLDAWLLAEGVERIQELDTFAAMGVPLGQGWLFGHPSPTFSTALDASLVRRMRALGRDTPAQRESVARLVDADTLTLPAGHSLGLLASSLGHQGVRVVVDHDGRPTAMLLDRAGHVGTAPVSLRVHESDPLVDVAQRALLRPAAVRWDPVVCVDPNGRLTGTIHVQRLLLEAVGAPTGRGASPSSTREEPR
ncbi:MAG TPA: EAL domain-containing protein [Actinomycetes bacterium]|nr:EAL domain-containing protein [Actinomycetes bacterium]